MLIISSIKHAEAGEWSAANIMILEDLECQFRKSSDIFSQYSIELILTFDWNLSVFNKLTAMPQVLLRKIMRLKISYPFFFLT